MDVGGWRSPLGVVGFARLSLPGLSRSGLSGLEVVAEPPGETHTLVVPDDVDEMVTLFHVTGGYVYVDPEGRAMGYEDVFTKLDAARAHYEAIGLGAAHAESLMR